MIRCIHKMIVVIETINAGTSQNIFFIFNRYLCNNKKIISSTQANDIGLYSSARFHCPMRTHRQPRVSPQPGQSIPVIILNGHTVPKKNCVNAPYMRIAMIMPRMSWMSLIILFIASLSLYFKNISKLYHQKKVRSTWHLYNFNIYKLEFV